jgi:RNA polymerase sigma factor (sigma-70 family)
VLIPAPENLPAVQKPAEPDSPPEPASPNPGQANWERLVARLQDGDATAMEELYRVFSGGIRMFIARNLGSQEIDDRVHDTFVIVVEAIRNGEIREAERLMGFVRTVVRRQVANYVKKSIHQRRDRRCIDDDEAGFLQDRNISPEEAVIEGQQARLMERVLSELNEKQREVLVRFYLREQPADQICREMNLTETQFRLLKSRAKARFGRSGKRHLVRDTLGRILSKKI